MRKSVRVLNERIVEVLRKAPMTSARLADHLEMREARVYHHLRSLETAGTVGRWRIDGNLYQWRVREGAGL